MSSIEHDLAAALERRAKRVVVEDGLGPLLDGTALVRATPRREPDRPPRTLAMAAAAVLVFGGGGLVWATRDGSSVPPASATEDRDPTSSSRAPDPRAADEASDVIEAVHLQLGDGWEMTYSDPDEDRSTWTAATRSSDDPDNETPEPSIHLTTISDGSNGLLSDMVPSGDVTVAGTVTTLYSNEGGSLHVAIVPVSDDRTVQVVVENASVDLVRELTEGMSPVSATEWRNMLEARSAPTTTTVAAAGGT